MRLKSVIPIIPKMQQKKNLHRMENKSITFRGGHILNEEQLTKE
jgi:hypothetical protein